MKTKLLFFMLAVSLSGFGQDSLNVRFPEAQEKYRRYQLMYDSIKKGPFKTQQVFSLSPISRKVDKVNGLTLGVGHFRSDLIEKQTVNGLNVELSPIGAAAILIIPFALPVKSHVEDVDEQPMPTTAIKVNGLNLTIGGFLEGAEMNGLNISTFTAMNKMKGLSISPGCLVAYEMNGVSITGAVSAAGKMNGLSVGFANISGDANGLQLGALNFANGVKGAQVGLFNLIRENGYGLQIGLVNKSEGKGFQIGLLNVNKKRALPFINW